MNSITNNKIIVTILLVLGCFFAISKVFAQTQPIQSEVWNMEGIKGIPYTQKIIKEDMYTLIAFSQIDTQNNPYVFYRTSIGNANIDVAELPPEFKVKDMVILNDTIYFCGYIENSSGFIARAKISDLFYNNYFDFDLISISDSIRKIEVYKRNSDNKIQIVAVGTDTHQIDFFLHSDEVISWSYDIYYNTNYTELVDDLEINDEYVVTVGSVSSYYSSPFGTGIIIRRYEKNNIPNNDHQMFAQYAMIPLYDRFQAKTIYGNYLAIVGVVYNDFHPSYPIKTLLLIADVMNPTISLPIQQNVDGNFTKDFLRNLTFYDVDRKMIILESKNSGLYSYPYDAAIIWDISNIYSPATTIDLYYGLDANNNHVFYNGIIEYSPYNFCAIGILDETAPTEVILWYGDRNTFGAFNCNAATQEQLVQDNLFIYPFSNVSRFPILHINWQAVNINNYHIDSQIICN
ncbi:MAG: hypothetical protein LBR17_00860 [Bacteroidales bacterium]|jgi:hypothetical protein|nr:hypothetical protein [Bacteroidales bacterium]